MTQFSFPWGCDPSGDGGSNSLTVDILQKTTKYLANLYPASAGVVFWRESPLDGLFAATNPGGNIVRIASGVGMVEGWILESDDDEDFDVTGGNANATDLIVLRRSNPGAAPQTVRLAHKQGPAAGSATVTQTASVWEIALWEVVLDGSGNFSSLTDVRELLNCPNGTMVKLEKIVSDGTIIGFDFTNIPDVFTDLLITFNVKSLASADYGSVVARVNGDTGNNYNYLRGYVEDISGYNHNGGPGSSYWVLPTPPGSGINPSPYWSLSGKMWLYDYKNPYFYKQFTCDAYLRRVFPTDYQQLYHTGGSWDSVAAINRINLYSLSSNYVTGSEMTLFGIR